MTVAPSCTGSQSWSGWTRRYHTTRENYRNTGQATLGCETLPAVRYPWRDY